MENRHRYYKWEVLLLLWIAFFLNQADRQIFNVLLPVIRGELHLTDPQMGLIASVLILVLALCFPAAGIIGDILSRKWICTVTIIFWSGATMLTGLSTTAMHLVLFRSIATGGGEAFFAPANYALLADYHKETRSLAMSIHQSALYLGVIVSGFLAAYIAELLGWRSAFYIFGALGIVAGLVMAFRLKDYQRVAPPVTSPQTERVSLGQAVKILFQKPTAIMVTIALVCQVFVNIAYLTWMPTFIFEKFHMSLTRAGFTSMFFMNIFAFFGIILSGALSDRLSKHRRKVRLEIQALGMLISIPFIVLMGSAATPLLSYVGLAGFGFFRGIYDANIYASLYEVIEPKYRASASGIMLLFAFFAGALAPYLLGVLKPTLGLSLTISCLAVFNVLAFLALVTASLFFFKKDHIAVD